MTEALAQGFAWGFALSLAIGPVFFALIQTSINKSFKAGAFMALGIMISDSLYILITYIGISSLNLVNDFKAWLGFIGGAIMVSFGATTFFKKSVVKDSIDDSAKSQKLFKYVIKGFALNGINPFVLIFWLGISSFVNLQSSFTTSELIVYFSSIISVVFSMDLIKVFLANRLRNYITPSVQLALNRLVGTGLFIFGFYLIIMTCLGKI